MIFEKILKRSFLLGILWFIWGMQNITTAKSPLIFILAICGGIIGGIQCIFSFNSQKHRRILTIILTVQAIYYLTMLGYIIAVIDQHKIFICAADLVVLAFVLSALYSVQIKR